MFRALVSHHQAQKQPFETKKAKACGSPQRVLVLPWLKLTLVKLQLFSCGAILILCFDLGKIAANAQVVSNGTVNY